MSTNITDEKRVERAILSLLIKGVNPSVEAIRGELALELGFEEGTKKGSPNEILRIKREWQEKLKADLEIPQPSILPGDVLAKFEQIWEDAISVADIRFSEERLEAKKQIQDVEAKAEQLSLDNGIREKEAETLNAKISELEDNLKTKDSLLLSVTTSMEEITRENSKLKAQLAKANASQEELIQLSTRVAALEAEKTIRLENLNTLTQQLIEANARAERLEAKNDALLKIKKE